MACLLRQHNIYRLNFETSIFAVFSFACHPFCKLFLFFAVRACSVSVDVSITVLASPSLCLHKGACLPHELVAGASTWNIVNDYLFVFERFADVKHFEGGSGDLDGCLGIFHAVCFRQVAGRHFWPKWFGIPVHKQGTRSFLRMPCWCSLWRGVLPTLMKSGSVLILVWGCFVSLQCV